VNQPGSSTDVAGHAHRAGDGTPAQEAQSASHLYLRPGRWSWYPRFELATVRDRVIELGEHWDEDRYSTALREYDQTRRKAGVNRVIGGVCLVLIAVGLIISAGRVPGSDLQQFLAVLPAAGAVLAVVLAIFLSARIPIGAARWRFFSHIADAIRLIRDVDEKTLDVDIPSVLNSLGMAARALLLALQRTRRAWRSPPMVSDRALRLSSALIDIDLPDDLHLPGLAGSATRELLHRFLHDVAAVVAIGRDDLIPDVREAYRELPRRSPEARELDLVYLNPMRSRSRWDVAKDFWYPLAPWLSLVVSAAALVISLTH
jgi:hypothetical protein